MRSLLQISALNSGVPNCAARKLPLDEPREAARVCLSGESPFLALFDPAATLVLARER
jgi:hypothetical protein